MKQSVTVRYSDEENAPPPPQHLSTLLLDFCNRFHSLLSLAALLLLLLVFAYLYNRFFRKKRGVRAYKHLKSTRQYRNQQRQRKQYRHKIYKRSANEVNTMHKYQWSHNEYFSLYPEREEGERQMISLTLENTLSNARIFSTTAIDNDQLLSDFYDQSQDVLIDMDGSQQDLPDSSLLAKTRKVSFAL